MKFHGTRFSFLLFLCLFFPLLSHSQGPARTTIQGNVGGPDGGSSTGTVRITNQVAFTSSDGFYIAKGAQVLIPVTNGALSVALVPNTYDPSGNLLDYYTADYSLRGVTYTEYWIVPATSPVTLQAVISTVLPQPGLLVNMNQITPPPNCFALGGIPKATAFGWTCTTGGGGTGGSVTLQTNGANNASQTLLNFQPGPSLYGLSVLPGNPSGGIEQFSLQGTISVPYANVTGTPTLFYQTIQNASGIAQAQRPTVVFSGSAVASVTDDPGNNRTIVTLTASAGSGVSILTNSINNASQTALNFQNGPAFNGLTINASNPSGGVEQFTLSGTATKALLPASAVYTDQANTFGAFAQDFSASTWKIPTAANCTASASNMICYDSVNNNLHVIANGLDATNAAFATLPVSGNVVTATVTANAVRLSDSGLLGTNVVTAAASLTNGNLVQGNGGTKTLSDSGIVAANVVTQILNGAVNQICVYTAANKTCVPTTTLPTAAVPALTGDVTNSSGSLAATVVGLRGITLPSLAASTGFLFDNGGILSLSANAGNLTTGTLPHAQLPALVSGDIPANAANTTGTAGGLTGCSPSNAGSICYWTGSAWTNLVGNASGTSFLQENAVGVPSWVTGTSPFYQTVQVGGASQTQQSKLNLIAGTNITITPVNNSGAGSTDVTITASVTAATSFSALTPATNNTAGSFVATGNTWDYTGATLLFTSATLTNSAAPASPAVGKNVLYSDSTDLRFHDRNASGVTGTTVVADAGASHNFLTAISAAGAISKAQPSFADISGVIASGQLPAAAVLAVTSDTNVTGSISAQNLTLGWTGTLAKTRTLATTVYTDQANTYSTGLQNFSAASLIVPIGAGAAPTASGQIAYDSTANAYEGGVNGVKHTFAFLDSTVAAATTSSTASTASALAGTPTLCSAGQPALGILANGNATGCASLTAAQVTNAFDRSTNNALGAHYFEMTLITAPANPAASTARIYVDSSTSQLTCLLSTGASCFPVSGGNANAALSNLSAVAINTSLLPGADGTIDLGSPTLHWRNIYFSGSLIGTGTGAFFLQGATGTLTGASLQGTLGFSSTGNRPVYDYNLGGFNNLVLSGVDINTSDQVTATHLASPLPAAQGGTAVTDLSFSGSTHKVCTTSGTLTNGDVVRFDASGNCVDGAAVAANLNANATNFTAGNLVSAAGTHSTQDSGIPAANVFSTTTKANTLEAGLFCQDAGATDAYACSLSPAITGYVTGTLYAFKANTANVGPATLNLNALGAITIKKAQGGITTDLADNDIRAGQWVVVEYDGTNMQMQSTLGNAATGTGTVTTSGSPVSGNLSCFTGGTVISNCNLSGDATTSGTAVVTVSKINGTAFAGTTGNLVSFGASNTPADAGFLATNVVRKDAANTGGAAMTLDLSGSTSFRLPNIAAGSSTVSGVLVVDTTNNMLHVGLNAVDNIVDTHPASLGVTDGDCVIWKKVGAVVTTDDRGACPTSGNTTSTALVSGNLPSANGATSLVDSGIVAANVTTNSTNYTNGNLIAGTGNHTANDSGIATANVVTQASNGANGSIATYTAANKALVAATALPNGITATTQGTGDNSTKVATTAYVDAHFTSAAFAPCPAFFQSTGTTISCGLTFTNGTITSGKLACFTASNTIGNCTALPPNNFVGVFGNASGVVVSSGTVVVNLDGTVSVTRGDILCASAGTAGTAHDNGSVACANGEWVGVVTTTAASVTSATAYLRLQ